MGPIVISCLPITNKDSGIYYNFVYVCVCARAHARERQNTDQTMFWAIPGLKKASLYIYTFNLVLCLCSPKTHIELNFLFLESSYKWKWSEAAAQLCEGTLLSAVEMWRQIGASVSTDLGHTHVASCSSVPAGTWRDGSPPCVYPWRWRCDGVYTATVLVGGAPTKVTWRMERMERLIYK